MQDVVAEALNVMLIGLGGQVTARPVAGLTIAESAILPLKLFTLVNVIEMATLAPELKLTRLLTEMVKSPTWTVEPVE